MHTGNVARGGQSSSRRDGGHAAMLQRLVAVFLSCMYIYVAAVMQGSLNYKSFNGVWSELTVVWESQACIYN